MMCMSRLQGVFMYSKSGKSKTAMKKHEMGESKMERKMEYGKKAPVRKAKAKKK